MFTRATRTLQSGVLGYSDAPVASRGALLRFLAVFYEIGIVKKIGFKTIKLTDQFVGPRQDFAALVARGTMESTGAEQDKQMAADGASRPSAEGISVRCCGTNLHLFCLC